MADNATHAACLSHTPSGQCIPVGSMTAAELKERQERWLACYKRRTEARRERQRQAEACCPDCADAARADPLDQARYHRRQAEQVAAEAVQTAGTSARALLADAIRLAVADMRRHFRLADDEAITVVPPAQFVDDARDALAEDPSLIVSDERAVRPIGVDPT